MHATPQSKSALDGELPHASANTSVRPLRRKVAPLQQLKQLGRAFRRALLVSRPGEESGSVEANLRRSEARIRTIIDLEPECVKIVSGEGRLLDVNPAGLAILEAGSLVEAQQRPLIEFVAPEYRAAFGDLHNRVMRGESGILQLEMIGLKGRRRQLETRAVPLRDDNGKVQNLLAISRDVTEHALSAQRSAEEFRILELIARAAPLADVLDALCRSVERQCEQGASCSILLLDADGVHLRHGAAPSLPKRTVRAIDGTAIGPSAGSSGTAAYLGKQVIVTDIANDPLWRDSREVALRDGLRACWSIPVFSDSGKVLATFAIYYRYVRAPTEAELRLIERAASLASIRITREKNERALRESEAKYRGLIEQASDGIFITDKKGIYQLANSRACELLGFAQSEMIGMHGRMTHLEGDWETYVGRLQSIAEGKVLRYERMMKRKEGSAFPVEVSAKKLGDDSVQFIFRDITERKQAEETLRESEAQYRGLIEQASDGIFVSDAQGNLLLANSRWCELLGYEKDQVAGINAKQTYLEEEREVHAKRLEHVRAGQTLRFERIVKRRDGSTFPAEISLKMLDNGCVQGIFHDITERREQESKIARLSRIQAVLSGINSAIVRMRDRQELLNEACRIAAMHGAFRMAWFGLLNQATGEVMRLIVHCQCSDCGCIVELQPPRRRRSKTQ